MQPDRIVRLEQLFADARELPSDEVLRFLNVRCGADQSLVEEVMQLLHADQESGVLDFAPTPLRICPDDVIAERFKIIRYIADGGMGTVYEAVDVHLGERVALKTIRNDIAPNLRILDRFRQEILLAKRVTHPNVCRVYDLGIARLPGGTDLYFLTMQFLEGQTLAERLKVGPISESEALPLISDMVDAISAAHDAGVIHRDFKSGNIMVVGSGGRNRAVVTDFGLARSTKGGDSLTGSGVVGTVNYMAPEQIRGEPLTPAVDVYALGVVIYEMVTGTRPFKGESNLEIALKHLNELPRPPREYQGQLHPAMESIILRCLKKLPSERFASARDIRPLLEKCSSQENVNPLKYKLHPRRFLAQPVSKLVWVAALILFAIAAGILGFILYRRQGNPIEVAKAPLEVSIAVLPLQNLNDTPEAYSFGLTEEIMNALGKIPGIRLIGPETSFHFKGTNLSPVEIGRSLNARYLLIGSVQRNSPQVRAIIRMIDASDGIQLWSQDITKKEGDVLLLPDDIVTTLSNVLNLEANNGESPGQSIDTAGLTARDLYWTGRFLFHQRTDQSVTESLRYFRESVKHDPNFAEAYSGIADALFVLSERGLFPSKASLREANEAARRAVALNPNLPAAYVSLGQLTSVYGRDLSTAEQMFHHALVLDPKFAPALQWLSYLLIKERRFAEAIQTAEAAVAADPLSTAANMNLAVLYFYAGSYDRTVQQCRRLSQIEPDFFLHHLLMSEVFARKGLYSESLHELASIPDRHQSDPMTLRVWVEVYSLAGMMNQAKDALGRLLSVAKRGGIPSTYVAAAYAAMGDSEEAFAWLEKAYDEYDAFLSMANAYPAFDSLRSDHRWLPLMAKLGIKETAALDSSLPSSTHAASNPVLKDKGLAAESSSTRCDIDLVQGAAPREFRSRFESSRRESRRFLAA